MASFEGWQAGKLTADQFVQVAALVVSRANARAVTLADMALAAALSVELGVAHPAAGVMPVADQERLRDGLRTLVAAHAAGDDVVARVERFAAAEPMAAAQRGWRDAMAEFDAVEGWVRQLDGDACELCQKWAGSDEVFPKTMTMNHHTGCQCTPKPVVRKG